VIRLLTCQDTLAQPTPTNQFPLLTDLGFLIHTELGQANEPRLQIETLAFLKDLLVMNRSCIPPAAALRLLRCLLTLTLPLSNEAALGLMDIATNIASTTVLLQPQEMMPLC